MSDFCFSSIVTEDISMKDTEIDRPFSVRDLKEPRILIRNGT